MQVVEFARRTGWSKTLFGFGLFHLLVGVLMARDATKPLAAPLFFFSVGALLTIPAGLALFRPRPRFRADADGVWFGGGQVIPWVEITRIFESYTTFQGRTAHAISFELRSRKTLLRTPVRCWLSALVGVGDIDVAPGTEPAHASVAKLEALRAAARDRR